MIEVQGPSLINSGDTVTLACRYDLGKDALYSMKWYKDDQEIYRYVPTDQPESHVFGVPGVAVNVRTVLALIENTLDDDYSLDKSPSFVSVSGQSFSAPSPGGHHGWAPFFGSIPLRDHNRNPVLHHSGRLQEHFCRR